MIRRKLSDQFSEPSQFLWLNATLRFAPLRRRTRDKGPVTLDCEAISPKTVIVLHRFTPRLFPDVHPCSRRHIELSIVEARGLLQSSDHANRPESDRDWLDEARLASRIGKRQNHCARRGMDK
jgi:hypothetical protein